MANSDRYQVYFSRDDLANLGEVLQYVATVEGHVRIVSVTWQPRRAGPDGGTVKEGYTIIAEVEG